MGVDLKEFFRNVDGKYAPGYDGARIITLPELLGLGPKGQLGGRYES